MRALRITIVLVMSLVTSGWTIAQETQSGQITPPVPAVVSTESATQPDATVKANDQTTSSNLSPENSQKNEISTQPLLNDTAKEQAPSGQNDQLPTSSSALPLLSVIGFGVLMGGIVSALKTR